MKRVKNLVIYHKHCNDGIGAALAVVHHMQAKGELIRTKLIAKAYGEDLPEEQELKGANVFIVDFSYHGDNLKTICDLADSVTIFDHHLEAVYRVIDTAFIKEHGIEKNGTCTRFEVGNLKCVLDTSRSGAAIAWEELHPSWETLPPLLANIQDRDLWKFNLPNTREVHQGILQSERPIKNMLYALEHVGYEEIVNAGRPVVEFFDKVLDELEGNSISVQTIGEDSEVRGLRCATSIGTYNSDLGGRLYSDKYPESVAMLFFLEGSDQVKLSFRSMKGTGLAVKYANHFGGGGHPDAAGAQCNLDQLHMILKGKLNLCLPLT